MALTKTQEDALYLLRARLDPNNPAFSASENVRAALESIGPYLDSWVLPVLDAVETNAPRWLAEGVRSDAACKRALEEFKRTHPQPAVKEAA